MPTPFTPRRLRLSRPLAHRTAARRGSTLMIVIVLLGLLSVLGVLFYTFAAAERSNAEYYSEGAKVEEEAGLPADVVMDHALQQLIVSTDPRLKNSALWGSRHSMLANMLGTRNHVISDKTVFDGSGINVIVNPADGTAAVDLDHDGMVDPIPLLDDTGLPANQVLTGYNAAGVPESNPQHLLGINDSPAANGLFERQTGRFPQPDVDYTYPDINNLFLAHVGWVRDRNSPFGLRRVIIPSFHRPQLTRQVVAGAATPEPLWEDRNYNGTLDGGEDLNGNGVLDPDPASNYATDAFKNRVLRPHPGHLYVPPSVQGATPTPRFIYDPNTAASATVFGDGKRVFPFFPMYDGYQPVDGGGLVTYTARPPEWIGHQGVWSTPHPSGTTYNNVYQYDCDNDGDGIREGIWLDLDFPVQELADGTTFIPMFSITVYDQNGLLDLNSHGNIQELLFTYPDTPFATNPGAVPPEPFGWNTATMRQEFISASNLGMHAGEVNPAWGLTGRPGLEVASANIGTVFNQYQLFYGNLPNDSSTWPSAAEQQARKSWQEVANMELAFLKMGRPEINAGSGSLDDLFPGIFGEEHLIAQNLQAAGSNDPRQFPHPGTSLIDDNNDLNEGMQTAPRSDTSSGTAVWLDVEQPFDALGIGRLTTSVTSPKNTNRTNANPLTERVRWPTYNYYAGNGNVFWGQAAIAGGTLMSSSQAYGLFDDPSELATYVNDSRDVDDPLDAADAAWLAMSNTDLTNLGLTSRVQDLAKFNFTTDATTNQRGEEIRKRFTAGANDRKSYAVPRQSGVTGRNWEWTDDEGNTTTTSSKLRFPPTFGDVGAAIPRYQIYSPTTTPANSADPFRPPLRFLLQATRDDLQVTKQYQQRLSVNQLLTYNNQTKKLEYRELTLHPLDPGSAQIVATTTYPPTTAAQQEFWARKDRQQLARDIYVLLYLLGPGIDGTSADNPTRTGWTNKYTYQQLEQMARFAVNLVDAQDRDNVITRFEYDKDLSNGWNLDDNPYNIEVSADRAEVWGVERQELTFSEVLAVNAVGNPGMSDYTSTGHDDSTTRHFLGLELRNVAPYTVKFTDKEAWQIVMRQYEAGDAAYVPATHQLLERRLSLKAAAGSVLPGGFYTIYSTDKNDPATNPSAFRVDLTGGGSPTTWIIPRNSTEFAASASANGHHIDLVEDTVTSGGGFTLTDGQTNPLSLTTAGDMLYDQASMSRVLNDSSTDPIRFALRRRAHPTRSKPTSALEEADNPYVEVDRIVQEGGLKQFNLDPSPNDQTEMETELANLVSTERPDPLSAVTLDNLGSDPMFIYNTFGSGTTPGTIPGTTFLAEAENSSAAGLSNPSLHWQVHFDRDFTSLGDLLLIPLVGPPPYDNDLSDNDPNPWDSIVASPVRDSGYPRYAAQMRNSPTNQYQVPAIPATTANYFKDYAKNAHGMFAVPDYPVGAGAGTEDVTDNRWHRVLEFIEVPTRSNRNLGLGSDFDIARVPGKINLNAMRHPEVLAGLIDDENVADLNLVHPNILPTPTSSISDSNYPHFNDATGETGREWFEQLQNSRDARDPYWFSVGGEDLRLPGTPSSRPFRGFSFADEGNTSFQYTLLRELPLDADPPQPTLRNLFEVGNQTEHQSGTVDPVLRHRLLSKIWNNTTTRSNTFVVFISAKLFRAYIDPTTGAVQVGGPMREYAAGTDVSPELPEYRGVFVVDRSDLEAAGQSGGGALSSFRPFVKYRRILKE